ncbi:MAG: hypothetical protein ABIQ62_02070 [Thermomonas sp.]
MKRFASGHRRRQVMHARWSSLPLLLRRVLAGVAAILLLAMLVAVLFRGGISTWLWPDSRSEELRVQAVAALQAGRLSASDGSGARELFEAALALQPDQVQAREGLMGVAIAALVRAQSSIRQGHYAQARAYLQLARELDAPRARLDPVVADLREHEIAVAGVDDLLQRADASRMASHFDDGEDSALPLYQRVLALQPRNQRAVEGREDALTDLLQPAQAALERGDAKTVAALLRRAQRFDPGHVELPALQSGLAQLVEQRSRRVRALVDRGSFEQAAAQCIELGGLLGDGGMPAPCNRDVVSGLAARARALASDFDFAASEQLLATARQLAADDPRIKAAQRHLAQARRGASSLPAPRRDRRTLERVTALLADAAEAQARGDWLTPPGESTWDKLRAARALAPDNADVQRALAALEPAARRCHVDALRENRLREAQGCLDVWRQLDPADQDLPAARSRLAQRWIAIGDQRLERGEINAAGQAAEQAQSLDPATPGLAELNERVKRSQPGMP